MFTSSIKTFAAAAAIAAALFQPAPVSAQQQAEWRWYAGNAAGQKYSPLDQITAANVHELEIVWRQSATPVEVQEGHDNPYTPANYPFTPLMVDGLLYVRTGMGSVAALSPTTGEVVWWDREASVETGDGRGLAYWTDGTDARIIAMNGPRLVALDARTGKRYPDFGSNGEVDLAIYPDERPNTPVGGFSWTAFPVVVGDVIVIGGVPRIDRNRIPQGVEPGLEPPGDIRGYDVRTGDLLWTFHVIPRPGEFGYETWLNGSADINGASGTWTWMTADESLGYVYVATEAGSNDMFGGRRPGNNLFSNSVLALDAETGERVWHYQMIHHDLWDFDNPTAPILVDIVVEGQPRQALVQLTKQALAYVLDRRTGEPIWPIEETPVPPGDTPGEWYSPTQPIPTKPPAYELQSFTTDNLIDFTPELREAAVEYMAQYRTGPLYTPPSPNFELAMLPGTVGGSDWHGAAFDPETGMLYVPVVRMPVFTDLFEPDDRLRPYAYYRRSLSGPLYTSNLVLPLDGRLPIVKPPYGSIVAIDLNKGEILWRVPNGSGPRDHSALRDLDLPKLGTPGRPSPLLTQELLFIGEGMRGPLGPPRIPPWGGGKMFRAYDKVTGDVVWELELPGGTTGAPMTYMVDGKQYIVVAVGWDDMTAELVALALP